MDITPTPNVLHSCCEQLALLQCSHSLYLHPQTHRAHIIYTIESILLDTIALHIAQVNLLFVLLVPMHSIVSRYSLPSHPTQPAALHREEKRTLILFHIPWPEQHELSTFLFHSAPVSITPFVHSILCIDERPRALNLTRTTQDEVLTLTIPSIVQKSNYSGDSPIKRAERFSSVGQFDGKHSISKSLSIHFRKMASYFS